MYHIERQSATDTRAIALARLNDLELLDARDRLLVAAVLGRPPRAAFAEQMAALEVRLARDGAR